MSTYFATFESLQSARNMLDELVRSGVRPDDVSLVTRQASEQVEPASVGDATAFVGREDDPDQELLAERKNLSDLSNAVQGNISGIDTSDVATNVESVDQGDDSQSLSEDMLEPPRMTTQSEHERDDLGLTRLTGFPTTVPMLDDIKDAEGARMDQMAEGLEMMSIPGAGTIVGGGALATAALDAIGPTQSTEGLMAFLRDEGLSDDLARSYCEALGRNLVLVAVNVPVGAVREDAIEQIAERWGACDGGLVDAPRFHEGGYAA
ncbi:MAG: hypothetical protein ACAH95_00250 [Fimbriimonas sp.]